jgi:hypothetical protein
MNLRINNKVKQSFWQNWWKPDKAEKKVWEVWIRKWFPENEINNRNNWKKKKQEINVKVWDKFSFSLSDRKIKAEHVDEKYFLEDNLFWSIKKELNIFQSKRIKEELEKAKETKSKHYVSRYMYIDWDVIIKVENVETNKRDKRKVIYWKVISFSKLEKPNRWYLDKLFWEDEKEFLEFIVWKLVKITI